MCQVPEAKELRGISAIGYALAGAVIATGLLIFGFFAWLHLFPRQADRLELGILVILLCLPAVGSSIGIVVGLYLWNGGSPRLLSGERQPIVFRPRSGSAVDPSRHAPQVLSEAKTLPDPTAAPIRTGNSCGRSLPNRPTYPRAEPASFMDGVMFLVVALVPGTWSAIMAHGIWDGPWLQSVGRLVLNPVFLVPFGVTVALVVCGVSVILRSREA